MAEQFIFLLLTLASPLPSGTLCSQNAYQSILPKKMERPEIVY